MLMNKPLQNCHILNTRPNPQDKLNQEINALGGKVISLPAVEITPNCTPWDKDINEFYLVIFISKPAVDCFFSHNVMTWRGITLAIGKTTQLALTKKNIKALTSNAQTSEDLLNLPILQNVNHKKILIIKGEGGRNFLEKNLLKKGAIVDCLKVYKRVKINYPPSFIKELWQDKHIDIILFTSYESMEHIISLFKPFAS